MRNGSCLRLESLLWLMLMAGMGQSLRHRRRSSAAGFTLVELLVVIAILVILATLLLPAMAHSKHLAQAAVCRNNLRQMALALQFYADRNDGEYPVFTMRAVPDGSRGWSWEIMLDPKWRGQNTRDSIFNCPMANDYRFRENTTQPPPGAPVRPFRGERFNQFVYNAWGTGGYERSGFGLGGVTDKASIHDRRSLIVAERATTESMVVNPSEMIAFGDFIVRSMRWDHDGEPNQSEFHLEPNRWQTCTYATPHKKQKAFKKHRGKMNRSFVDGHVEFENMNNRFQPSVEYLRRWNIDYLPHGGPAWGVW